MNQRERLKFFAEASRYLDREALSKVSASLFVGDSCAEKEAKDYGTARSGNWGHKGRPGYHGGSAKGTGGKEMRKDIQVKYEGAKKTANFRSAYKKAKDAKTVSDWHASLSNDEQIAVKDQHANICKQTGSKESYEQYAARLFKMMTTQYTPAVTIPKVPPTEENPVVPQTQSNQGKNEPKIVPTQGQGNIQPQPQNANQTPNQPAAQGETEQQSSNQQQGAYSSTDKKSKLLYLLVGSKSNDIEKMLNEMSPTDRIAVQYTWKGDKHNFIAKAENGSIYVQSGLAQQGNAIWTKSTPKAASSMLAVLQTTLSSTGQGSLDYVDYLQDVQDDEDVKTFLPKVEQKPQSTEEGQQKPDQPSESKPESGNQKQETQPQVQNQDPVIPIWQQHGMTKSYYEGKMSQKMMQYIKGGKKSALANIINNFTDQGDKIGFTYKVFSKGQVSGKVSQKIVKNADGTFSRQATVGSTTMDLPTLTAEQMIQHMAECNDYESGMGVSSILITKAKPKTNAKSETSEQTPAQPQKPVHAVKHGDDISHSYKPDKNAKSKINDIIHQQGFDGIPKVVQDEEFDSIVKNGQMPLMLRTYSGISEQQVDDFDRMLEQGEWYVECSTGGAFEGQGMYTVASYNSEKPYEQHELKMQMGRYQRYSRQKAMLTAEVPDGLHKIKDTHTGEITMIEQQPTTFGKSKPKDGEIVYLKNYHSTTYHKSDGEMVQLDASYRGYFYSKGKLYVINDQDIEFDPQHEDYMQGPDITKTMSYYREADKKKYNLPQRFPVIRAMTLDPSAKILTSNAAEKLCAKYNKEHKYEEGFEPITDHGQIAAIYGYDAISAQDTGNSSAGGSYLIVVNRTKVILKKSRVVKKQMYKP